jgi:hypothetical protein
MRAERDRLARPGGLIVAVVAVPLAGVANMTGPQPIAALGFAANLTVLGLAGGRVLLGRAGLSAVERVAVALALPIAVLVLGTITAGAIGLHLDRPLWAVLVAVAAEATAAGLLYRWRPPAEPRCARQWRAMWQAMRSRAGQGILWGATLAAAGAVLAAAITLSGWTAAHQAYPAFSALSAVRTGSAERSVRIQLTSQEAAPTRFIIAVAVGRAGPATRAFWLAPGGAWRETVPAPRSAAVTVIAYRGNAPRVPYREVHLAPRGGR